MKSQNKDVEYGKGYKCLNCGRCNWRIYREFEIKKHRILEFYCVHCCMTFNKLCDINIEGIKNYLNEQMKGGKKNKK